MAYTPTSEDAKAAIAAGADPIAVEEMEKDGTLPPAPKGDDGDKGSAHDTGKETDGDGDGKDKSDDEGGKGKAGEGDSDKDGNDDDDGKRDKGDGPNRTVQTMPVWKAKELAKAEADKRETEIRTQLEGEMSKRLAEMTGKTGADKDDALDSFATEFSVSPDVAGAMLDRMTDLVGKRLGIDEIRKNQQADQALRKAQEEEDGFKAEWGEESTQKAIKAAAGDREITVDVQKRIKELAYDERYAKYRLSDIVRLESDSIFGSESTHTAERSRGGSGSGRGQKDVEDMSTDDINSMSDDEFLKFSNDLGKNGSRFMNKKTKR